MNLRSIFTALALAAGLAAPLRAQCFTPDGLDAMPGAMCVPGTLTAASAAFKQKSTGICWRQCGVDATANYDAIWSAMTPSTAMGAINCGWYSTRLQLMQGTNLRWLGVFNANYSRTWYEQSINSQFQVWRFLVNGDMRPGLNPVGPCAIPSCCAPNGNKVRFTGYVDYAFECGTGRVYTAWMITHACDSIDHDVGSPRAGTYHPDRYWSFLGPAASFVPTMATSLEVGTGVVESVRNWNRTNPIMVCNLEEPLINANFNPMSQNCLCSAGAPLWYEAALNGIGAQGTFFTTLTGQPGFQSVNIGTWTNANKFPGVEEVRWNCSTLLYQDPCTGVSQIEHFYGATTAGGFLAFQIDSTGTATILPSMFIDQSNSRRFPLNTDIRNVMFRSDHVLNLNL